MSDEKDVFVKKVKFYCDKFNIHYPDFTNYESIKKVANKINNKHYDMQWKKEMTKIYGK